MLLLLDIVTGHHHVADIEASREFPLKIMIESFVLFQIVQDKPDSELVPASLTEIQAPPTGRKRSDIVVPTDSYAKQSLQTRKHYSFIKLDCIPILKTE